MLRFKIIHKINIVKHKLLEIMARLIQLKLSSIGWTSKAWGWHDLEWLWLDFTTPLKLGAMLEFSWKSNYFCSIIWPFYVLGKSSLTHYYKCSWALVSGLFPVYTWLCIILQNLSKYFLLWFSFLLILLVLKNFIFFYACWNQSVHY